MAFATGTACAHAKLTQTKPDANAPKNMATGSTGPPPFTLAGGMFSDSDQFTQAFGEDSFIAIGVHETRKNSSY